MVNGRTESNWSGEAIVMETRYVLPIEMQKYKEEEFEKFDRDFPLRMWDLWMEGYSATGESSDAVFLGQEKGRTFPEAVRLYFAKSITKQIEDKQNTKELYRDNRLGTDYDFNRLSIWACRLYDNETDARKSFG